MGLITEMIDKIDLYLCVNQFLVIMSICFLCQEEFTTPKSQKKKDKLYFLTTKEGNKEYICDDCHYDRSNCDFRMIDGEQLCSTFNCARNSMAFSKYCDVCEQKKLYDEL